MADHPAVYAPLIASAVGLLLFLLVEARFALEPIMPIRFLRDRSLLSILAVNFFTSANSFSSLYFWPTWSSAVLLTSTTAAGLHLIPNSIALSIGSVVTGWLMRRTGRYWRLTFIGALCPMIGFALMLACTASSPAWLTYAAIAPNGLGFTTIVTSTLIGIIASVPRAEMAVATSATYLFRYSGQTIGVAASSAILQAVLAKELRQRLTGEGSAELIERIRHTASIVRTLPPAQREAATLGYQQALRAVFAANLIIALFTVVSTFGIKEHSLDPPEDAKKANDD